MLLPKFETRAPVYKVRGPPCLSVRGEQPASRLSWRSLLYPCARCRRATAACTRPPLIFISYRRVDTKAWANHLLDDLRRRFGSARVFMDIRGGIRGGDDFERVLRDALERCKVLLAVIGPHWTTCQRSDGRLRLCGDDDWVRRELATALERGIVVVPVLFGREGLPAAGELPPDLQALLRRRLRRC